jgi:predicted transcriptional regulator
MRTIAVRVDDEMDARLESAARRRRSTKSALVREALSNLLEEASPTDGSVLQAGQRYVGIVSGPSDLSTNPSHMRGYGR